MRSTASSFALFLSIFPVSVFDRGIWSTIKLRIPPPNFSAAFRFKISVVIVAVAVLEHKTTTMFSSETLIAHATMMPSMLSKKLSISAG